MSTPITLDLTLRQGDFTLTMHESFEAKAVALFGPSGSGKTTILDIIAGFPVTGPGRDSYRLARPVLVGSWHRRAVP